MLVAALDTILINGAKDGTWTDTTRLPSESLTARYLGLAKTRHSLDPWVGLLSAAVREVLYMLVVLVVYLPVPTTI